MFKISNLYPIIVYGIHINHTFSSKRTLSDHLFNKIWYLFQLSIRDAYFSGIDEPGTIPGPFLFIYYSPNNSLHPHTFLHYLTFQNH